MNKMMIWILVLLMLTASVFASTVAVSAPANNTFVGCTGSSCPGTLSVTFKYVDDNNATEPCRLYYNGASVATNASTANNTNTVLSYAMREGTTAYYVNCTRNSTSYGVSTSRTIKGHPSGFSDCDSLFNGWANFVVMCLIICILLTAVLGKEFLSTNKWIFTMMFLLLVAAFAITVLNNMVNPCGV